MSQTLTGVSASFNTGVTATVTAPSDGDAANVASVNGAFQSLLNGVEHFRVKGGKIDEAGTWSAQQAFNGTTGDDQAGQSFSGAITTRKLYMANGASTGTAGGRIYVLNDGSFEWVANATWNASGGSANKWTQDNAAADSLKCKVDASTSKFKVYVKSSGASAWDDSSWAATGTYGPATLTITSTATIGVAAITQTISSATGGGGQAVPTGGIYSDTACVGWAHVTISAGVASIGRSANISSVNRTGAGVIVVTLQTGVSNRLCPVPAIIDDSLAICHIKKTGLSTSAFTVLTYDSNGTPNDHDFFVHVFGG